MDMPRWVQRAKAWYKKNRPRLRAHGECHGRAASEVAIVTVFSLAPLAALPIGAVKATNSLDISLFWKAIGAGQLYLYGFALFGTLMWLCIKENERTSAVRAVFKRFSLVITILPAFFMMMLFVINPEMAHPLSTGLIETSVFFYVGYTILYYMLLVLNDLPARTVSDELGDGIDQLEEKLKDLQNA